jgi:hypothetical protein
MITKFHLSTTSDVHIVEGLLSGGNVADIKEDEDLTEEVYGCYVVEDKGCDSDAHRASIFSRG